MVTVCGFTCSVLGDAGGYNCWDTGRGIFHNKDKTFLTWVNEEDHFRFISMQMGGNLGQIYKRLVSVSTQIVSPLCFCSGCLSVTLKILSVLYLKQSFETTYKY